MPQSGLHRPRRLQALRTVAHQRVPGRYQAPPVKIPSCPGDYLPDGSLSKVRRYEKGCHHARSFVHALHTTKLQETYGADEAATSFSNSAIWHWELGDKESALNACRFVISKLMPKMDRSNIHQSFVVMYPVVLVMKSYGVVVQARKHFDRLVVTPFTAFFGEGKSFFLPFYEPIMMLLPKECNKIFHSRTSSNYVVFLRTVILKLDFVNKKQLPHLKRCDIDNKNIVVFMTPGKDGKRINI